MLAAATICDSQGFKNKFFMGIGYRFPFSHTALLPCPTFSPALLHPSQAKCNTDGSWANASGGQGDYLLYCHKNSRVSY